MSKRRLHYVLSTHWDREWYQSLMDYRYRLVQLLDRVIEGFADGRLKGPFQCDGQAIMLEDYLEVRPERRALVEQLSREGKFVIGPWYVLPDEFLVSGESIVRNLRLGRQVARDFGGVPSQAGFACDMFGHNSQMPQIYTKIGVPFGFQWRGINLTENRHFIWRGADGTEMPNYRFGRVGYCSYAILVRHPGGVFDKEVFIHDLEEFIQRMDQQTQVDPILLFDGCDHQEWDPQAYEALIEYMTRPECPYEFVHSSLDAYLKEVLPQVERIEPVLEGELREPGLYTGPVDQQWLIPGVLSSRVWIKQANAECESLLCQWAEPINALAHASLGREYPQGYLNLAWKWLLKNHPHDSICGCSIDTVHEDMKFRFSMARQIGNRITAEATMGLAKAIAGDIAEDELRIVLFNPLSAPVKQSVDLVVQTPKTWPTFNEFFGFEPKPAFRLYDADGQELPYQRLAQANNRNKLQIRDGHLPESYQSNDVTVSVPVNVPAMGYTTLTARCGDQGVATRHPSVPGMATSERSMANALIEVTIEANGTLTVLDKRTGRTYSRLLTFEDVADIGDGWYHGQAVNDQVFVSTAGRAEVALIHNGPQVTTFRVRTTMGVPAEFRFDSMTRSDRIVDLVIDSLISLRPDSDRIEVQTTVNNVADDHRLRVLLPSGAQTDTYLADSPFDVVERSIALRKDNHIYRELEVETKPQQSWTAVFDGQQGLAVLSSGLLETAVRDLPDRPLALTLFRGTRRTVMTNGEPEGQLRGMLRFRYWIAPLAAEPDRAALCLYGQMLVAGLRDVQLQPPKVGSKASAGPKLPVSASFLAMEGPVVVTSARMVEGALEVRMFNPNTAQAQATLRLGQPVGSAVLPTQAQRVNLESTPMGDAQPIQEGAIALTVAPKEIVTLRLS
ncbi:MAG: glycoside hydrolase family 38 N-terminal domain-containing protein [Anaerolineae bacterium]